MDDREERRQLQKVLDPPEAGVRLLPHMLHARVQVLHEQDEVEEPAELDKGGHRDLPYPVPAYPLPGAAVAALYHNDIVRQNCGVQAPQVRSTASGSKTDARHRMSKPGHASTSHRPLASSAPAARWCQLGCSIVLQSLGTAFKSRLRPSPRERRHLARRIPSQSTDGIIVGDKLIPALQHKPSLSKELGARHQASKMICRKERDMVVAMMCKAWACPPHSQSR